MGRWCACHLAPRGSDRAAGGLGVRRGGARLRVRTGARKNRDKAGSAEPDLEAEARFRHEGEGVLLRRHARPLPLLSIGASGGGTAGGLPQAVGLVPRQLNVANADTAGFPGEKILVMTAQSDAAHTTGVSVIQVTWLQKNNGTN